MQAYKYKGFDSSGQKVEGEVMANTAEEVEKKAAANLVTIISIYPTKKGANTSSSFEGKSSVPKLGRMAKKPSDADIAVVLRDMAVMSETGIPFVEAIDSVIMTARTKTVKAGLENFRREVVGGRGLSQAMKSAEIFPQIVCEMVKVAEEGGRLDEALSSAANYVERSANLKKKIMNAMLYPIVLITISVSTVLIMLVFVLPRFAGIFKSMKVKVPETTQFLLNVSNAMRSQPILVLVTLAALVVAFVVMWKQPSTNRVINRLLLRVPVLGELLRRLALSRSMQSISTLLSGNISMLSALEHGAHVAGNPIINDALMKSRRGIEHGASLSESLAATKAFPIQLIQMVTVGERTGRLAALMANSARYMEEDVDARLKALISIVEPLMVVVMGLIVGFITLSVIIPLYSIVENVK